ncbi:MAG: DUF2155 domain-containing protein [Alphaproteobacteria bacterium]|nr:DUF2155 domain-containing protein [Alphaproteobacteria bacterium]
MKKYIIGLFAICAFTTIMSPANAYIDRETAVVRIMNKAAGKAQTVTLPVGRRMSFEKLDLLVRSCKQTDPFQAEDFFMFIEISQDAKIFSGWMSRNEPGNNPLQHPDYDLWLVRCE